MNCVPIPSCVYTPVDALGYISTPALLMELPANALATDAESGTFSSIIEISHARSSSGESMSGYND